MGMFDYVHCEFPLPGIDDPSKFEFQTKDLACSMETLTITKEGRLLHDEWHYEDTPKEKRPYPDAEEGSFESVIGCLTKVVDKPDVDLNYHGYLNFYDSIDGKWVEFKAKFTDGTLVAVDRMTE